MLLWISHWVPCSSFESLLLTIQFPLSTGRACILISSHLAFNSGTLKSSQVSWFYFIKNLGPEHKTSIIIFTYYAWNCYVFFNTFFQMYFLISVSPVLSFLIFLSSYAACHVLTRNSIVEFNVFWNVFTYIDKNRDMFSSTFFLEQRLLNSTLFTFSCNFRKTTVQNCLQSLWSSAPNSVFLIVDWIKTCLSRYLHFVLQTRTSWVLMALVKYVHGQQLVCTLIQ